MAIQDEIQRLVKEAVQREMAPMRAAMQQLADAAQAFLSQESGRAERTMKTSVMGAPSSKRKPGRPAKAKDGEKPCVIKGCPRAARSKGYCSAHYQKRRNLAKSKRLPAEWKDNAPPQSIEDVKLPRGRAAAKAKNAA